MATVRLKVMDSMGRQPTRDTILEAEGPGMRLDMGKVYTGISQAEWDSMPDEAANKMSEALKERKKRKHRDRINAGLAGGGNHGMNDAATVSAQDSLRQADATRSKVENINKANAEFWSRQSA